MLYTLFKLYLPKILLIILPNLFIIIVLPPSSGEALSHDVSGRAAAGDVHELHKRLQEVAYRTDVEASMENHATVLNKLINESSIRLDTVSDSLSSTVQNVGELKDRLGQAEHKLGAYIVFH